MGPFCAIGGVLSIAVYDLARVRLAPMKTPMKLEGSFNKKIAVAFVGKEPDEIVTLLGVEPFGIWIDRSTSEQETAVVLVPFSQIRFVCPLQ